MFTPNQNHSQPYWFIRNQYKDTKNAIITKSTFTNIRISGKYVIAVFKF